jgi:hypothetical protein
MTGRVVIIGFLESQGWWKPDMKIIVKNILEQLTESFQ